MIFKLPQLYDYTLPHKLDRVGQVEAFEAVMEWYEGPKQYMILSAPTGIGKTAVVAEMSKYARIMALARTKVLLTSVYKGDYNFDELQGKINHPCRVSPVTHRADVCAMGDEFDKEERYELCEGSGGCSYYVQYDKFCASERAVTTYAKYTTDRREYNSPSMFIFDEAHEVPDLVIERSGINLDVNKHKFLKGYGLISDHDDIGHEVGIEMMRKLYTTAVKNAPKLKKARSKMSTAENLEFTRSVIRHRQFLKRLEESGKLMVESDLQGLNIWHYSSTAAGNFSARPMSAGYHFKHILNTGIQKTLMMSATIDEKFSEFVGLTPEEVTFYQAPQQFPVTMRRIYDLGVPGMGHAATKKSPALYNIQAVMISNVLKLRPDVSSVILVTSKVKAYNLGEKLQRLGHDVFVPQPGVGTDIQLKTWENYRKPGAVCVSYNFWEGVSLNNDHMLFIAGIKYPDLGSAFEKARANRSWSEFNYRAAINVIQGTGREQRGYLTDYLPVGSPTNLTGKMVFIADGNWARIAPFAPGDFVERIVPWV